ncbi:MAG: hypothetical protein K9G41_07165 [Flavobacteriales bacterium]|nr:hypothetical protein [Flavobacteriales bacterium]
MGGKGNTTSLNSVEDLLLELKQLQSKGDSIYQKGIFPSQRHHPFLPYKREDDNLFFTASVVHILQGVNIHFSEVEKSLVDEMIADAKTCYRLFKNKDGLDTYNFWQTKPSRHFPNGKFMHRFKHFQIPDDVDDTALVFLTENVPKERVAQLRERLKKHANLAYKRAFNPLKEYRNLKCYSTFFGEKMYIEFDLCVLSNLMRVVLPYFKDELNEYDRNTLAFITDSIMNDEHNSLPFYSAPNYPTTELILYHVSRLIPLLPLEYKTKIESKIKADIQLQLKNALGMNKVMLENAALKLNLEIESNAATSAEALNDKSFFFFHAGMITAFENGVAQKMANSPIFHLRYTSKALNRALLIENIILKRSLISPPL